NGVHKDVPVARGKPAPAAKGPNKMPLLVGGGVGLAAMAGVMVWALFLRGGGDEGTKPVAPVPVAKINLNDSAPPAENKAGETAKAEPKKETQAGTKATTVSAPSRPTFTVFADSPKSLPPQMPAETVERVKKSAVMLRCTSDTGAGEGSGWFAEPGIIVTNAHVVNMKDRAAPPPQSIRVFLNSGLPDQQEVSGKLLALDRENDLAVVQVKAKNMPEPLPICPSSELYEGQRMYVMGFPLGSSLAMAASGRGAADRVTPTVKFRQSSVSGRLAYKNGGIKLVQLEGGADHGNSGGAVLDTAGTVRSILVAGFDGTTLRWVIPSEYAVYLLQGRLLSVTPGQATREGAGIRQPFTAMVADPMKRIKKITLDVWAGDRGSGIRPASDRKPSPQANDSPVSTVELAYDPNMVVKLGEATPVAGNCSLPLKKDDQVYWVQPKYERIDGSIRWGEAVAINFAGLPVDAKGAKLAINHVSGTERKVEIISKFGAGFVPQGYPIQVQGRELKVKLTEKTRALEADGAAKVQFHYDNLGFLDEDTNEMIRERYKDLFNSAKGMSIEALVTKRGLIRDPKANLTNVPAQFRPTMANFNSQIMSTLEGLALLLPEKDLAANDTWDDEYKYTFQINRDNSEPASYRLRFKYLGSRMRNGREEGVVTFNGVVVKGDGSATTSNQQAGGSIIDQIDEAAERRKGIFGITHGAALIDIQTGVTTLANTHSDVAIDVKIKLKDDEGNEREVTATYGAVQETVLQRFLDKNDQPLKPDQLLPNQEELLNPFVGAPDPNIAANPSAGGSDGAGNTPAMTGTGGLEMKKEVRDKVKAAACLIRCNREGGGGDGSGWLAEPGIVVTNAHVIGMVDRAARPPLGVDVYFDAGMPSVKKFAAKILTVDHDNDLAVLQLPTTEGLPEPMPIVPSGDLFEGQRLFVLGFPMGQRLGSTMGDGIDPLKTQLKVRDTSVAGRLDNKRTGLLKYIQVEGGLTPGNSGGALVDMNGAVRCVAVAIMPGTQIGFTIPSEYAARLLQGFPLETKPQYAYKDGSVARMPVEIKFGDPLKRVKKVQLDYWVGQPGNPRRSAKSLPKLRPGDLERKTVDLTYDAEKAKATGDFILPEAEPGTAYWVQPRYVDGQGQESWGDAVFFAPDGPPLDRRDVALKAIFKPGASRLVDVNLDASYRYVYLGSDMGEENHLFVTLAETVGAWNAAKKGQMVGYQFTDLRFGQPRTQGELLKIMLTLVQAPDLPARIRNVLTMTIYNKDGTMSNNVAADLSNVQPITLRPVFSQFNDQVLQCIQTMSVKLPNATIKVGDTWSQPTNLLIAARSRFEPALFTMNMKYLGVRDRGGRLEAVVEIKGAIAQDPKAKSIELRELKSKSADKDDGKDKDKDAPKDKGKDEPKDDPKDKDESLQMMKTQLPPSQVVGKKKPLYGNVHGYAYIDVESGHVSFCKLFLDIDVEMMHKDRQTGAEIPVQAGGTVVMQMNRRTSNK
ncbi:MAG: trypsin-like peptidase domain-containing protein, partial [Gemmataceae bacterium]|nr:trypsin-like peptidase domain-containing protein [Gemmataceae bacterium]